MSRRHTFMPIRSATERAVGLSIDVRAVVEQERDNIRVAVVNCQVQQQNIFAKHMAGARPSVDQARLGLDRRDHIAPFRQARRTRRGRSLPAPVRGKSATRRFSGTALRTGSGWSSRWRSRFWRIDRPRAGSAVARDLHCLPGRAVSPRPDWRCRLHLDDRVRTPQTAYHRRSTSPYRYHPRAARA